MKISIFSQTFSRKFGTMYCDDRIDLNRVYLKPFSKIDITSNYISWLNNKELMRFSNQQFKDHTYSTCMEYFKNFINSQNGFWTIFTVKDDMPIGTVTAFYVEADIIDIGILIGEPKVSGLGFGQEVWNAMTEHLISKPKVKKLIAGCYTTHIAMQTLLARSGFTYSHDCFEQVNDRSIPTHIYQKVLRNN